MPSRTARQLLDEFQRCLDLHRFDMERVRAEIRMSNMGLRARLEDVTPTKVAKALEAAVSEFQAGRGMRLYLFRREDTNAPIGDIALSQIARGPFQACYLGYRLDGSYEGQGYMSEAVTIVVQYAFGTLNLHRIMANYMPTNERSARVLRRCGFIIEGHARDYLRLDGQWRDHVLTSLTNSNWKDGEGSEGFSSTT